MTKVSSEQRAVIAPRFSRWLSSALAEAGQSPFRLAQAWQKHLNGKDVADDSVPRRLTLKHLNGTTVPGIKSVAAYGDALRGLGLAWCSAEVALYAAGYFEEFVQRLVIIDAPRRALVIRLLFAIPFAITPQEISDGERAVARELITFGEDQHQTIKEWLAHWDNCSGREKAIVLDGASELLRSAVLAVAREPGLAPERRELLLAKTGRLWFVDAALRFDPSMEITDALLRFIERPMSPPPPVSHARTAGERFAELLCREEK